MPLMEPELLPPSQTNESLFDNVPEYVLTATQEDTPPIDEFASLSPQTQLQKISASKLKAIPIRDFAFDLVIYGEQDRAGVLSQYDLLEEELVWLLQNHTSLQREIQQVKAELDSSQESGIRMRARNVVEVGLMSMHDIITAPFQDPQARVKAFEAAAKVADLLPKTAQRQNTSPIVEINFGPSRQSLTINPEGDRGVIDVQ